MLTKKRFDYDVTMVCTGVRYSSDEDVQQKAEYLVHSGLGLPGLKVVRAMRTPYYNKPGVLKIEFQSTEDRKIALGQSGRLRYWNELGFRVLIRESQPKEARMQSDKWRTWMKGNNMMDEYDVNRNGRLLPRAGSTAAANVVAANQVSQTRSSQGNSQYG